MATAKKYLAFIIPLISLAGILFLVSLGLFIYFMHSSSIDGAIIVNADTVVPFTTDGFNTLFTKDLTVVSNIDHNDHYPLNISFYKTPCNKISKTIDILSPVSRSVSPDFSLRLPFNYRYGDRPLYAVGDNSTLIYTTIASTNHNISDCPLKLYLFTDKEKYQQFKYPDNPETGYVASSKCLPVGTNNSSAIATTTFKLVSNSLNYVAVYVQGGVSVTINITGSILKYSLKNLKREPCFLHNQQNSCVISISESTIATSSTKSCVVFYSPHNNGFVNYTTSSTQIHNIGSVITIIVSGLVFVCLFLLLPISLYYIVLIWCSRRSEYEKLSDVGSKIPINY